MSVFHQGTSPVTGFGPLLRTLTLTLTHPWSALQRKWRNHLVAEHLGEAPDYLLRDIGITRSEIRSAGRR